MDIREILGTGVPVGVRNYRAEKGWKQAKITEIEDAILQKEIRERNNLVMEEALFDAKELLEESGVANMPTPHRILELATFLAERRIVHVSRIYDLYLTVKIADERGRPAEDEPSEGI